MYHKMRFGFCSATNANRK